MVRNVPLIGERINMKRVLLGKPVRKRRRLRLWGKWVDNTKLDLKHRKRGLGLD